MYRCQLHIRALTMLVVLLSVVVFCDWKADGSSLIQFFFQLWRRGPSNKTTKQRLKLIGLCSSFLPQRSMHLKPLPCVVRFLCPLCFNTRQILSSSVFCGEKTWECIAFSFSDFRKGSLSGKPAASRGGLLAACMLSTKHRKISYCWVITGKNGKKKIKPIFLFF